MSDLARSWLTVEAAAVASGRSERTIRRWITAGRLRHLELGGTRYVNERELLTLERETRRAARAGRPGARNVHILDTLRSGGLSSPEGSTPPPPAR